jgi:hypothetical protein
LMGILPSRTYVKSSLDGNSSNVSFSESSSTCDSESSI